jgi:hypothetical protein
MSAIRGQPALRGIVLDRRDRPGRVLDGAGLRPERIEDGLIVATCP